VDELKKLSNGFSNADRADRRLGANDCHHHNGWLRPCVCQCVVTAYCCRGVDVSGDDEIWHEPICDKLNLRSVEEEKIKSLIVDALLGIQAGQNPRLIDTMLRTYPPASQRAAQAPV